MKKYSQLSFLAILAVLLFCFSLSGCASKVTVRIPPRIDLQPYQTVGIIGFSSNSSESLNRFATRKFISIVQANQPGVRFLELDDEGIKPQENGEYDRETLLMIGKKHNIDTVFTGNFELSELKPSVSFTDTLKGVNASAMVRILLNLRHMDTKTGAIIWSNAGRGKWPLASVRKVKDSPFLFTLNFPPEQYEDFIAQLIAASTKDFQVLFERRKVKDN